MSTGKTDARSETVAEIGIEAAVILRIGIVRFFIVFEAVNPQIVVHVDSVKEVGSIYAMSQEGLIVVGDAVGDRQVIILVEVGYEVVVFIPAGEDAAIASLGIGAH